MHDYGKSPLTLQQQLLGRSSTQAKPHSITQRVAACYHSITLPVGTDEPITQYGMHAIYGRHATPTPDW
jgi:hypothetical protein